MAARLRVVTAIALGLAALALVAFGLYLLVNRDASWTERELRSWGPVKRALFVLAHARHASVVAGMAIVGGLLAAGLAYLVARSPARWPLVVVPVGAVALIAVAQWVKGDIEASEPPGYRDRSTYVQAARWLAATSTVYLVVLALLAAAAWWLGRPRPAAAVAPGTAAPPAV